MVTARRCSRREVQLRAATWGCVGISRSNSATRATNVHQLRVGLSAGQASVSYRDLATVYSSSFRATATSYKRSCDSAAYHNYLTQLRAQHTLARHSQALTHSPAFFCPEPTEYSREKAGRLVISLSLYFICQSMASLCQDAFISRTRTNCIALV